jgi:xanthine dehydrogenase small subunit
VCGACTVLVDGAAIRSCLMLAVQAEGAEITTIEGIGGPDGTLSDVQEAFREAHGLQCGFCTPGFVVSMCAMFEEHPGRATAEQVRAACVGNLCRCTGYESIVRSAATADVGAMRPLNALYPPEPMLREFRDCAGETVIIHDGDRSLCVAASVSDAVTFRAANPGCTIIAGGTDIGVQVNKGVREPTSILSLSSLADLRSVIVKDGAIVCGALASIDQLERACRDALPEYARLLYWFGSPPIRNAGTIGGNIANGSPIGDSMPAMYVLNGEIELTGPGGARRVNINDFYTSYKRTVAQADEIVTAAHIPLPASGDVFKLYKVSKRKDLDISAFTAAIWMRRNGGEVIEDVRIAYGGVGPNIVRLRRTEEFFRGNALTGQSIREAGRIARTEISPITDVRGSAEYRAQLSENILRKMYAELSHGNGIKQSQVANGSGG